jgi:hypothetical protein
MLVSIRANHDAVKKGRAVKLEGTVSPDHDGNRVEVQRRTKTGRWKTAARTRVTDSTWSKRMKMRSDGVFRVRVLGDADHLPGISPQVFVGIASSR